MQKEPLSIMTIKTLLVLVVFAGSVIVILLIIGGISFVADLDKRKCEKSGGKWDFMICNHQGCEREYFCDCTINYETYGNGDFSKHSSKFRLKQNSFCLSCQQDSDCGENKCETFGNQCQVEIASCVDGVCYTENHTFGSYDGDKIYNCVNNSCQLVEESNISDTSDWQTYQNEEFGFKVKYPEEWNLIEDRDLEGRNESLFEKEIAFVSPFEWEVGIPTDSGYKKEILSFEVSCAIYKEYNDPCEKYNYPECGEITLLDNSFRTWEGATPVNSYVKIIIPREDFFIVISSIADISPWNKKEFNQILSTFKFTD